MATMETYDRPHVPVRRDELPWALRQGAMFGIAAGLVFAAFEMVASAALMGAGAFFMPLRMIGAIALGSAALDPSYPLAFAGLAGLVVHVALSVIYGMIFAVIVGGLRSRMWDTVLGGLFGLFLWVFNFYVVAPRAFPWFLESNPFVQFVAHTFFFGAVLGYLVWRARTARTATVV
jgi:hypothetical protein